MPPACRIIVTFDVVGFHHWPGAISAVPYLGHVHRHVFEFRIEVDVRHGDRDVEFHMLKREALATLRKLFPPDMQGEFDFGARSCEAIALMLFDAVGSSAIGTPYPVRAVEVWEDGENGARIGS